MHKIDLNQNEKPHHHPEEISTQVAQPMVDETKTNNDNQAPLHSLNQPTMKTPATKILFLGILLAISGGVATGFGTYRLSGGSLTGSNNNQQVQHATEGKIAVGDVFGSQDTSTFKDTAQGYLEAGGIDGEGSHKLLRPGGVSQSVYLTSSVTNLSDFEGMEVKIWGETFKGQQAGWLMDVGRVEILATDAQPPID